MPRADSIRIVPITSAAQLREAHAIRRKVFIQEQHVPEAMELDQDDERAFHVLALDGKRAVGCGRFVAHESEVKIGRMAVTLELRGSGIGRRVLEFLMDAARQRGHRKAVLHAQLTAEGFYLKQGFTAIGEVFEEAGIMHRKMEREL